MSTKWATIAAHYPNFDAVQMKVVLAEEASYILIVFVLFKAKRADSLLEFGCHWNFREMGK